MSSDHKIPDKSYIEIFILKLNFYIEISDHRFSLQPQTLYSSDKPVDKLYQTDK